jgi:DNA polymerase-3 subunit delta'
MPFTRLVGHRRSLTLLARAVARDTLPPALVFAGPAGVGKFAVAAALAESLNCEAPVRGAAGGSFDIDACGRCRTCVRLQRAVAVFREGGLSAVDCLVVLAPDQRGSIRVDPTRAVIERTAYRPLDGRRRLVVIDEADALEVGAQNALLKVLEEPPGATAFVLVTSRPDVLLATIRSRCPRLRFTPLTAREVETVLVRDHAIAESLARRVAVLSDGRPGQALTLAAGAANDVRHVALEVLTAAARSDAPSDRLAAARVFVSKDGVADGGGRKKGGDAVSRVSLAGRVDALGALLRDVQIVTSRADARWMAAADLAAQLTAVAGGFDGRRVARAFAAVDRARAALERNGSPKVVADWLALQL